MNNPTQYLFIILTLLFAESALAIPKVKIPVNTSSTDATTKNVKCSYSKRKDKWSKTKARKRTKKKKSKRVGVASEFNKAAKAACKSLVPPKTIDGLGSIPPLSQFVKSGASKFFGRDVSGTAPTLKEIGEQNSAPDTFWREGVVERIGNLNATPDDCNEFYGGNQDGASAGLAGCFLAQETARSLENMLGTAVSVCYLKSIAGLEVGNGVTIVSGEENLPSGGFKEIFSSPKGSETRIVKMRIVGQSHGEGEGEEGQEEEGEQEVFVFPHNKKKIKTEGKKGQYGYDLYFCEEGEQGFAYTGFETTTIGKEGKIDIISVGDSARSAYENTLSGYLTENEEGTNSITFNTNLGRSASIKNIESDGTFENKAELVVTANNIIRSKIHNIDRFDDVTGAETRRSYSVIEFSGDAAGSTRFLQGSYKDRRAGIGGEEEFSTSIEFRDERYVSAPDNTFSQSLSEVDLDDVFYEAPSITFDSSTFDCSTQADIVILLDFESEALLAVQAQCELDALQNMDFCFQNDAINLAEQTYGPACQEDRP